MYYVIKYDGLRKIMDVKHDMQKESQNQRFPSALADLMKTGDMYYSLTLCVLTAERKKQVNP